MDCDCSIDCVTLQRSQLCGALLHPSTSSWAATIASHCLFRYLADHQLYTAAAWCKLCTQRKALARVLRPHALWTQDEDKYFWIVFFCRCSEACATYDHLTRPGPGEKRTTESNLGGSPGGRIVFRGPSTRGELARAWADCGLFR